MVEQDTVRLLRECDAGVKMGVSSIDDVLEYVKDSNLKKILCEWQGAESHCQGNVLDEDQYEACYE